jgi:hypothetical protein
MADCGSFINPLDLQCLLVNVLSGNWTIFAVLVLVVIAMLAATFRMPNAVVGTSILLFSILFFDQMPWLYYITILIASVIIWTVVITIIKR